MNTVFEVYAANADARYAAEARQAAFALVDRLEGELSRFRPNSDITRLNHLTAGESARVGEAALECLLIARHVYDLDRRRVRHRDRTGLPSLEIDADAFEVRATASGVRLDLGGIGKGYAVDLVANCSRTGASSAPSCTAASAPPSRWSRRPPRTAGR
jgi:thiamine biosynthesis lipoprotein